VSEVRIAAEPRTEFGKGGARRTRRAGKIPAVLYGHGQPPRHISLPGREFTNAIKHGANTLLTIEIDGGKELALAKALQRDPIKQTIDHVDLLLVRSGEKVTIELPVVLTGEVQRGGLINQELTSLSVEADATKIPDGVEVPIDDIEIGSHLTAKDVKLPDGVTLITDPEAMVVAIVTSPSAATVEAELESSEAELGIERDAKQPQDA
jgi:large subunit ribosomal protein L25